MLSAQPPVLNPSATGPGRRESRYGGRFAGGLSVSGGPLLGATVLTLIPPVSPLTGSPTSRGVTRRRPVDLQAEPKLSPCFRPVQMPLPSPEALAGTCSHCPLSGTAGSASARAGHATDSINKTYESRNEKRAAGPARVKRQRPPTDTDRQLQGSQPAPNASPVHCSE